MYFRCSRWMTKKPAHLKATFDEDAKGELQRRHVNTLTHRFSVHLVGVLQGENDFI